MTQSGHRGHYAASLHSGFLRDKFREDWSLGDINAPTSSNGIAFRVIFRCGDICIRCVSAVARIDEGHRTRKDDVARKGAENARVYKASRATKDEMEDRARFMNECIATK